jgi:hypothetical protein
MQMAALAAVAGTGALAALLSWLDVRRKTAAPELVFQQTSFNRAILDKCPILHTPYTPRRAASPRPSTSARPSAGPCQAQHTAPAQPPPFLAAAGC